MCPRALASQNIHVSFANEYLDLLLNADWCFAFLDENIHDYKDPKNEGLEERGTSTSGLYLGGGLCHSQWLACIVLNCELLKYSTYIVDLLLKFEYVHEKKVVDFIVAIAVQLGTLYNFFFCS
jgi:hypothetical protein